MLPLESEDIAEVLSTRKLLCDFIDRYNLTIDKIYSSSGRSYVVFAQEYPDVVFQYYETPKLYDKVCNNLDLYPFIKVFARLDDYCIVVYERLVSLHQLWKTMNETYKHQLVDNISDLISELQCRNLVHGDMSLDNIGYSALSHRFTAFDVETLSTYNAEAHQRYHDSYTFNKSLNFWNTYKHGSNTSLSSL
jgi:hypothetical protein